MLHTGLKCNVDLNNIHYSYLLFDAQIIIKDKNK
jgi:hypothetical protein